eukprot:3724010-Rhodomonas_salina.1
MDDRGGGGWPGSRIKKGRPGRVECAKVGSRVESESEGRVKGREGERRGRVECRERELRQGRGSSVERGGGEGSQGRVKGREKEGRYGQGSPREGAGVGLRVVRGSCGRVECRVRQRSRVKGRERKGMSGQGSREGAAAGPRVEMRSEGRVEGCRERERG